jgi:enoyl-[acyl-carrier protein] reductase I
MDLLKGKRGLIVGVANERSLAYGIAKAARQQGAELALTYQNERLESRVRAIGQELGAALLAPCDVSDDASVAGLATRLRSAWPRIDFLVHAVAFAQREELAGRFLDTSREGFRVALDVSAYSLVALCRALAPHFPSEGGSVMTLSYYGSEKVVPNYNIMGVAKAALESTVRYLASDLGPQGIRVNALSPGPVKTLSAAGVKGLRGMLEVVPKIAPLRRNIDADDVGQAALFLLSDLGRATTGEVIHVDAGYHVIGATAGD